MTAPAASDGPFIPNFFDPQGRLEKPDLAGVKHIRFLTEDDYPPFHFAAPNGDVAGFNIDLARAICDELQVTCTIQVRRWDTMADALDEGQGDAIIASLAINDQNRKRLDFSAPYYATPARFLVPKGSSLADVSPSSLAGKTIAVVAHSAHEAFLQTFYPQATLLPLETPTAVLDAVKAKFADAAFGDGIGYSVWLASINAADCCEFRGGPYTESRFFGEGVGIGMRKGNIVLRRALNYALARLSQRGIYADLYLKYFLVGFY
jgi:polar amino acid transport system substrate-binding protein